MVNCCVPHCTSNYLRTQKIHDEGGDRVSYHEFPCDVNLKKEWLKVISRDNFSVNDKSNSSRVCSKHFKKEDFISVKNGRRLKPGSIPSVFTEYPVYMQPSSSTTWKRREPKIKVEESEEVMEEVYNDSDTIDSANTLISVADHVPSATLVKREIYDRETSDEVDNLLRELRAKEYALNIKVKKFNEKLLEVRNLKRKLAMKDKKIHTLSKDHESMSKKLSRYAHNIFHKNLEKILALHGADAADLHHDFLLTQLKYAFSEAFRWPERVLRECILLHAASPKGYQALIDRKLIVLPSKRTLKRFTGPVVNETGVSSRMDCKLEEVGFIV